MSDEQCARCGHRAGRRCGRCGEHDPLLGGQINGDRYCHTFSWVRPTCYEVESRGLSSRVTGYVSKYML